MAIDDSGIPKYTRRGLVKVPQPGRKPFELWQLFNGTDTFFLTKNDSEPSGYTCHRQVLGFPKAPLSQPWSYVQIDADATPDGTDASFDGVTNVARWVHDRPKKGMIEPGNMTWRVDPAATRLLRTSFVHTVQHTGEMASGERDFSANFTVRLPTSWEPPPDVLPHCKLPKNAYVPAGGCSPDCGAGSLCCREPTDPKSAPACYGVYNCAQLPGPGLHLDLMGSLWDASA
jgi:hypothetical protein